MKRYVFDSYAILAFLEDEPGADLVEKALREAAAGKAEGFLSVIKWGGRCTTRSCGRLERKRRKKSPNFSQSTPCRWWRRTRS